MECKHNESIVPTAKMLRKNMTREEKHLWYDFLNKYPIKFTRQKVLGKYIADFYCAKAKLVIEIDGSQHYTEQGKEYDENRTEYLRQFDLTVIRFKNDLVMNEFFAVCNFIDNEVKRKLAENN